MRPAATLGAFYLSNTSTLVYFIQSLPWREQPLLRLSSVTNFRLRCLVHPEASRASQGVLQHTCLAKPVPALNRRLV